MKGQTGIEYLIMIGGVLLVALIVGAYMTTAASKIYNEVTGVSGATLKVNPVPNKLAYWVDNNTLGSASFLTVDNTAGTLTVNGKIVASDICTSTGKCLSTASGGGGTIPSDLAVNSLETNKLTVTGVMKADKLAGIQPYVQVYGPIVAKGINTGDVNGTRYCLSGKCITDWSEVNTSTAIPENLDVNSVDADYLCLQGRCISDWSEVNGGASSTGGGSEGGGFFDAIPHNIVKIKEITLENLCYAEDSDGSVYPVYPEAIDIETTKDYTYVSMIKYTEKSYGGGYIGCEGHGKIIKIRNSDGTIVNSWEIPQSYFSASSPSSGTWTVEMGWLAVEPNERYIYFTLSGKNSGSCKDNIAEAVYVLDTQTGSITKVTGPHDSCYDMGDITYCGGYIYFTEGDIFRIDPSSGSVSKVKDASINPGEEMLVCLPNGSITTYDPRYAMEAYYLKDSKLKVRLDTGPNQLQAYVWEGTGWQARGVAQTSSTEHGADHLYLLKDYTCHDRSLYDNHTGNPTGSCPLMDWPYDIYGNTIFSTNRGVLKVWTVK